MPVYRLTEELLFPDPRCVLFPQDIYVSRRLARLIRQRRFHLTCNLAFAGVVTACADLRIQNGEATWLISAMQDAYRELHALGFAHSVEAWYGDELVGGLYGVALGKFFFGESMFHRRSNASKVILAQLARYLDREGFLLLDCQVPNPHLQSMGARDVPREDFLELLAGGGLGPGRGGQKVKLPADLP